MTRVLYTSRHAACVLALLGQSKPLARGVRVLFEPTFHETVCIVLDEEAGLIEMHRLPSEVAERFFWQGNRWVDPDPNDLVPTRHPSDVAGLDPEALAAVHTAAAMLPEEDPVSPGDWRDGMIVRCEIARGGTTRVYGESYPLGDGPRGHSALALEVLRVAMAAFPADRVTLEPLSSYAPRRRAQRVP